MNAMKIRATEIGQRSKGTPRVLSSKSDTMHSQVYPKEGMERIAPDRIERVARIYDRNQDASTP